MTTGDELRLTFLEEVQTHINTFNQLMLMLETHGTQDEGRNGAQMDGEGGDVRLDRMATLAELQRLASTLKGAAHSIGAAPIETVAHYIESILAQLHKNARFPDPALGDTLYDGADLIIRLLPQYAPNVSNPRDTAELINAELQATIIVELEESLARVAQATPEPDNDTLPQTPPPTERGAKGAQSIPDNIEETTFTVDTGKIKLLDLFQLEAEEYLVILNDGLLRVEMESGDERRALFRDMNRVAHSLRGAARAVGWSLVETIAYHMEEIFEARLATNDKSDGLTPEEADSLYDGVDVIQQMLAGETISEEIQTDVLHALTALSGGQAPASRSAHDTADSAQRKRITQDSGEMPTISITTDGDTIIAQDRATTANPSPSARRSPAPDGKRPDASTDTPADVAKTDTSTRLQINDLPPTILMRPAEETIRVAVSKLDTLMAQTSELLVTRQQNEARVKRLHDLQTELTRWQREWRSVRAAYIRLARRMQESLREDADMLLELSTIFKFLESNQRHLGSLQREVGHVTQEMQQDTMVMGTLVDQLQNDVSTLRMMPFATITGGYQRLVRDLARDTGKHVQLFIEGASVEIDKTVLEALKDPLLHLLRNAVDHGIEAPDERTRLKKSAQATIRLSVEQRGSEILMQVRDDGKGIDVARIRRKAIERQRLTATEADTMNDDELRGLIFESGFSTSDTVTTLSGRGLGMDIVRTRVESLRGRISIESTFGQGTTISINVPVSLTRIRAVVLHVGAEMYALPAVMITRMAQIRRDEIFTAEGKPTVMLNNRPVPLADLGALLGVSESRAHPDIANIVALSAVDRTVAFEVDALSSEVELVLKSLGAELAHAPLIAGAALRGSGDVIVVLDGNDLVRQALGAAQPLRRQRLFADNSAEDPTTRPTRVLVVDDSITTRTLEKNILEAVGFDVSVAIDGVEAWSLLSEVDPDIVISDVEMPNMNGLELTRLIKGTPHTAHLPVILLTSLAKPEQREAGLQAGADAYLVKSRFDQRELLTTIAAVL